MTYPFGAPASQALFDRALSVTPGGVNSPVRAFRAVGGTPRFMVSGRGPYLVDADGREYLDLVGSWGPMILGHAHPQVVEALHHRVQEGWSFGTPSPTEVELAEEIVARVAPVDQVRFVSSGTEATMSAIRLARGFTGRDLVVKFAGCYHGHVDALLASAGSGLATLALPDSAGVPAQAAAQTVVLPYNDLAAVEAAFADLGDRIACVITEAAAANMGVVPPVDGFNAGLARLCHDNGALYISDEVMTGFRVGPSGWFGLDGVPADLFTFGKVIGGGLPAAALGGRADVMGMLAPVGPVYQAGTLSGNPMATLAGLITLRCCDDAVYERLDQAAASVGELVTRALTEASVQHRLQVAGNLFSVFFVDETVRDHAIRDYEVRDYEEARRQQTFRYAAFFHELLARGVYLPPSAFEAWFVSAAHDETALERLETALPHAARAAAEAEAEESQP